MADPTLVPRAPGNDPKLPKTWIMAAPTTSSHPGAPSYLLTHVAVQPLRASQYRLSSQLSDEDVPLLMRFMHKPLRAQQELKRASDPTRRNSLLNANLGSLDGSPVHINTGVATLHLEEDSGEFTLGRRQSDELNDGEASDLPYRLVRKKSGEIVKPLLKDTVAAINRSRSLPLTPTYKQVHFGGGTDVRYFKQKDRPAAILAQNSPTLDGQSEEHLIDFGSSEDDSDDLGSVHSYMGILAPGVMDRNAYEEYFDDELNSHADTLRPRRSKYSSHLDKTHYPKVKWQLELLEFPLVLYQEKIMLRHMPVFMEQAFLSIDKKYLLGQIAVKNLLYEKHVTVRYTLDGWDTVVEIPTIYVPDPPPVLRSNNYDRFVFSIPLELLFTGYSSSDDAKDGIQEQVYDLCVRYATQNAEYWDNNDNKNYLIKLRRIESPSDQVTTGSPAPLHMPSIARSKRQAHIKKPKYSSSYLKRIVSEPSLSKSADLPVKNNTHNDDHNDFEQNNYYLSSPLLLSLKNKDVDDHPFAHQPRLARGLAEQRSPSPASNLSHNVVSNDVEVPADDLSPNEEEHSDSGAPVSPVATRHKRIDSMTYKELLESYCFFSTPSQDNGSTATLVLSDEPTLRYDKKNTSESGTDSIEADSAFTVSSFLRN